MSKKRKAKLKIGITGGIGGGKSTFSGFIEDAGHFVLNVDELSKSLMVSDKRIAANIIKTFGAECYLNGELNTKYLAERVFSNPISVNRINSIVHPRVIEEVIKITDAKLLVNDLVFVESALIFEAKMEEMFDYIIVVTADLEKRIERIQLRDNASQDEILKRMENQTAEETKRKKADFVFVNNSGIETLKQNAEFFIKMAQGLDRKRE